MTDIRLALDVGTTAIKAAAFAPSGRQLVHASTSVAVHRRPDGSNEQDPIAVWIAAAGCLRQIATRIDLRAATSLGVCAQGDGFWPLDAKGVPIGNAILWSDTRDDAAADLAQLTAAGALGPVGRGCNTALWPGTSAIGWRWLRRTAPAQAARVAHVGTCGDWIGLKLTGSFATDFSNATIPFLDLRSRSYGAALSALECDDLRPMLPRPRSAAEQLGTITAEAADETGLPTGLPVSVATLDLGAMIVGLGMARAGETMMILGTTAVVNILSDSITPTDDPIAATVLHPTHDVAIRVLAPSTGAAALDWFASLHPVSLGGDGAAEIVAKLNALVQHAPIGANGVIFLPYLNGERAPFVDPGARAGFLNLSATTGQGELGRAVMEGTAFSLRHCFEAEAGLPREPVRLTGGGANNPIWCQIIADVIGQDVLVNPSSDLGLWGAACLGAAALTGEDPIALARRDRDPITTYPASTANHAAYEPPYKRYTALSQAVRAANNSPEMPP